MGELVQLISAIKRDKEGSMIDRESSIAEPQSVDAGTQESTSVSAPKMLDRESILNPRLSGKQYWRSLEELADTEEFQELIHREFPENATEWNDPAGRRRFLKLMGASFALAGLTACTRQPTEYIAPYVRQPEEFVPGRPSYFATAMPLGGFATGLIVESHEGRPTKIEGNKDHPASLGATDAFSQASILGLYDPDRSQTLTHLGEITTWSAFLGAVAPAVNAQRALGTPKPVRSGLRILTETVTSPTLANQLKTLLETLPTAKWHQYEPAGGDNVREGSRLAFGQYANTIYHFDKADVVVSLDSDFLACGPASLRYARDFAARRKLTGESAASSLNGQRKMSRLYVIESTVTTTGSVADNRLPMRPGEIKEFARGLAASLGVQTGQTSFSPNLDAAKWMAAIAKDLLAHRGTSVVVAGESQPAEVHAIAHSLNSLLGNVGQTVSYTDPIEAQPANGAVSLQQLVADMNAGQVDVLLILGGNPVYNAPADLDFANALLKVPLRIHTSLYTDETSELCQWHIPEAHYLEAWGDARAFDGTASIIQPLIAPLYSGKSSHEVLAAFLGQPERSGYDIVREYWQRRFAVGNQEPSIASQQSAQPTSSNSASQANPATSKPPVAANPAFEKFWRKSLRDGFVQNTALPLKNPSVAPLSATGTPATQDQFDIVFRPDATIHDGRFANNGWLQELPKPVSKLTWDNAAIVSPATAASLGLGKRVADVATNAFGRIGGEILADQVELEYRGRSVIAPVFIQPGQPDNVITVHLGYGRTTTGRVGTGAGFNAYSIRTSDASWFGSGLKIRKTGGTYSIATTQSHHLIDASEVGERDLVRSGTLDEFKTNPSLAPQGHHESGEHPSLYPAFEYKEYAWGMAIDLNSCIGCSACIVACVAENNIPVVGKEQVARSREMHWLRVDSYYKGGYKNPETYFQPIPCQQCENAPCEVVCPVAATAHSAEGLNDMTYNRCVGTRYCSNNCPYKVRRFNFLLYQDFYTASLKMMRNPNVSVRSRGVMEKCTYCVQRIQKAKIDSEKEDRKVRDGEITPACAQSCPTEAIVFGDINDKESRVAKLKSEERNYSLLGELNTKPRTTYLGAVRNRNPELNDL